MLAPEEIFYGKGDIKEETELTQTERKRRRANKKRRYTGNFLTSGLSHAPYSSWYKPYSETLDIAIFFDLNTDGSSRC
jgi:hypothetical protein